MYTFGLIAQYRAINCPQEINNWHFCIFTSAKLCYDYIDRRVFKMKRISKRYEPKFLGLVCWLLGGIVMVWLKGEQKRYRRRLRDLWRGENYEPLRGHKERMALGLKAEKHAIEYILPQLGFRNISSLNNYDVFKKYNNRYEFPWDIYAEKEGKWVIEVTTDIKEDIQRKIPFLWKHLKTRMGVIFVSPRLDRYCFKEVTDLNKTQVSLSLKDIGERQMWGNQYGKGFRGS